MPDLTFKPTAAIAGYVARSGKLESLTKDFDAGRLPFSERRKSATDHLIKMTRRGRDMQMVAALILGLAATSIVLDEVLSPAAWALTTLAPAIAFSARSWSVSARLTVVDLEARRVHQELAIINARHNWLQRAARLVPVLNRSVALDSDRGEAQAVVDRAMQAERKLQARLKSPRYANLAVVNLGWPGNFELLRASLSAAVIAGTANSLAFAYLGRSTPVIVAGIATSAIAAARLIASRYVVERCAQRVMRVAIWNKQRDLLSDIDKAVHAHAATLIGQYRQTALIDLRDPQ